MSGAVQTYKESITRKEALRIIYSKEVVSVEFVTLDLKRNTGGGRIFLKQCINSGERHNSRKAGTIGLKSAINSGHPYSVHIPLILSVNGARVL